MLTYVQQNLDTILAIVGGILTWLLARPWSQAQKARVQALVVSNNLQTAQALAEGVAVRVYADAVRTLKDTNAWNGEMKRKILNDAVAILKAEVKEHGLEIAEAVLPGLMQKAVDSLKSSGAQAKE